MKEAFRESSIKKLKELDLDIKRKSDQLISKSIKAFLLQNFVNLTSDIFIGLYSPLSSEVNWRVEDLDSFKICLPVIQSEVLMKFAHFEKEYAYNVNGWHIDDKCALSSVDEKLSVIFIPGLGFSKDGKRLGRGAGYYDRYLKSYKGIKVGLTYECMIDSNIPSDSHDVKMDYLITEKDIYYCKG